MSEISYVTLPGIVYYVFKPGVISTLMTGTHIVEFSSAEWSVTVPGGTASGTRRTITAASST
jgi:hypothetical protein